jgi:VanZ family protein
MTTHSVFLRRAATVICAVVWLAAATATHIPMESLSDVPVGDVVLHFVGYLGLTCVYLLTLRLHGVRLSRRVLLTTPILLLYGVLDEATQPLVNRFASIHDWLADAAGVSAACLLDAAIALLQRFRKHR